MIQQYYHTATMRDFILNQYGVKRYEETIELSESFFATILVGKHSFTTFFSSKVSELPDSHG